METKQYLHSLSPAKVYNNTMSLNNDHTMGVDEIPNRVFKKAADKIGKPLSNIFNTVW